MVVVMRRRRQTLTTRDSDLKGRDAAFFAVIKKWTASGQRRMISPGL
jgi:hypothetical protein